MDRECGFFHVMLVGARTLVLREVTSGGLRIEYCVMEFSYVLVSSAAT